MSQRFADPIATSVDRDVLEPLKSYFKDRPFYYDPLMRRDEVGRSFERYVKSRISKMVSQVSGLDNYSVSRIEPDYLISPDDYDNLKERPGSVFGVVRNRVVEIMDEGNFKIYSRKMMVLTEIDDFLRYKKPGMKGDGVPIIFEATVSKNHGGMSARRKYDLVSDMMGRDALYVGIEMGDTPTTKIFDHNRWGKKMIVGSVPQDFPRR